MPDPYEELHQPTFHRIERSFVDGFDIEWRDPEPLTAHSVAFAPTLADLEIPAEGVE